jgi:hypothetical protein
MGSALDVEIARVTAAAERADDRLHELRLEAKGGCCPDCVLGERWTVPVDAQQRRLAWLRILLGKRGAFGDAELARDIERDIWP